MIATFNFKNLVGSAKMLSNEIPRCAQLEDGSKASSPPGQNIGTKKGLSGVLVTYFSICDIQPVPSTPHRNNTSLGALLLAGPRS